MFLFIYQYNYRDRASDDSEIESSTLSYHEDNYLDRVGDDAAKNILLSTLSYRVFFFHWHPPDKLKYGKPRLGESTLT